MVDSALRLRSQTASTMPAQKLLTSGYDRSYSHGIGLSQHYLFTIRQIQQLVEDDCCVLLIDVVDIAQDIEYLR